MIIQNLNFLNQMGIDFLTKSDIFRTNAIPLEIFYLYLEQQDGLRLTLRIESNPVEDLSQDSKKLMHIKKLT